MSTRSGRASRAAAPTSFVPDKVNRGWGTSRTYATGRTTPVRNARRVAKGGAGGKQKSEAAKRIEAAGGVVRKFHRVRRAPTVRVESLLTGDTMASATAGFTIWKWVAEDDITEAAERKELGLDPLLPLEEAVGQNIYGPTAKAANAAEAERAQQVQYQALVDAEDEAAFDRMTRNRENPYTLTFKRDGGPNAKSGGAKAKPSAVALSTPASTTTAAAAAAASASYALAISVSSKAAAAPTAAATVTSSHGSSAGEKRKATRDPTNDPNRLATGLKRRGAISKDRRYQGLSGETPCNANTTRGKPCLNACAPNSKFCFLHNPSERYDSDGEDAAAGYGSSATGSGGAVAIAAAGGPGAAGGSGHAFAPSMQSAVNRGGGKWKSEDITEKCERYNNQAGREKCAALTTRGKPCGFCASLDKGGSIYCPVHRSNFERSKEKFERQQERARAELEAEKAAANNPAFAPSGSGQAMTTSTANAAAGSTDGSGIVPTGQNANPTAIAQQQALQQQPRSAVASQPQPHNQYHQQQQMHYGASAGGALFQMDPGYIQQQQHYQQTAAAQMQHQHHYQQQHQYPQQHQNQLQNQHQQQHPQYQWPGP